MLYCAMVCSEIYSFVWWVNSVVISVAMQSLKKALAARRQFVPWGAGKPFKPLKVQIAVTANEQALVSKEDKPVSYELPPGVDPLILWESSSGDHKVQVDNALTRFLRPHQREGVQFMFECVAGLREFEGYGCILADDMGLGKTLQGISLLWTLLNSGHDELGGNPMAKRVVICCPTSLVSNWDSECSKWLNGRVRTIPLCESSREDVISSINQFLSPACQFQLLIVSYETFRLHSEKFEAENTCDLLICDEAHRLKNDQTLTNKALASMDCKRRVLLSGTPMQNQLQEFYAMVNFCNPGVLGSPSQFRKRYENPIVAGREPDASDEEKALGQERSAELSSIVNEFILRRTNNLLSQHLPPKVVEVVCCRMTPIQFELYSHFVQSRTVRSLFSSDKSAQALSAITSVRKLLNHPKLIYDEVQASNRAGKSSGSKGFEGCERIMEPGLFDTQRGSRGSLPSGWEKMSGKFLVATRMLELLRIQTKDRVVIVSNFTQTLDLFSTYCREKKFPCLRLDGSTSNSKREKLVKQFNDPNDNQFVFLLSSKAGGCGLNLIGGNRLILFDMSWNPAEDKQAAARVWRDGQRRRVYVYKFMTTGTIEEKIFQRQLSKEGLQSVVDAKEGATTGSNAMSMNELRDLFSYNPETFSTTYDHFVTNKRQKDSNNEFEIDIDLEEGDTSDPVGIHKQQSGNPKEEELADWGHHSSPSTVPDQCMQLCGEDDVTFVFSCQVDGRPVDPDPDLMPLDAFATNKCNNHTRKPLEQIRATNRPHHIIKFNDGGSTKPSNERGELHDRVTENVKKQRMSSPIKDRRKQKPIVISDSDDDFI